VPDDEVLAALQAAYDSGDWGRYHGRNCAALAEEVARFHGVAHAALCCSGTIAVELALRGGGIGPEDEVVLAGYDFPGNFRAVEAAGARVVLVDVHESNWNFDPDQLEAACGPKTKAVIVSHLHGGIVSMRRLVEAARSRGLFVVEDACQCPGAMIEGRRAGTWGDVGVWSFGGSKLLTAGRGGALFTNSDLVHQRIKVASERGNDAFPLSELQAAVLLPQLRKLDARNAVRAAAVGRLLAGLAKTPGVRPLVNLVAEAQPAYFKVGLKLVPEEFKSVPGISRSGPPGSKGVAGVSRSEPPESAASFRDEFLAAAGAEGVALDEGFRGFSLRGSRRCRKVGELRQSQLAAERMMILHHPVLLSSADTIDRAAAAIAKVAGAFCRA
jgi:dTDP-4-amino-4,6-dideoxygalactose transaminase